MSTWDECRWIRLHDGRRLGFAIYGAPSGWPVLYFHGNPTSRIEARFFHPAALEQGCMLIALDRPGYGLSDPLPGRRIIDWPTDVNEFIDSQHLPSDLQLEEFSLACFSSGSAYALACAARLPESRVKSIGIVSGVAPLEKIRGNGGVSKVAFRLANRNPRLARAAFNINTRQMYRRPDKVLRRTSRFFSQCDARIFFQPATARILIDSYLQTVCQGPNAVVHDMSLLAQPWGFEMGAIRQRVKLWYGACDIAVPPGSMGVCLNESLTGSRLNVAGCQGHLSMLTSMGSAVFRQLKTDAGVN